MNNTQKVYNQKLTDTIRSAEAICLRKIDYSETSQIATFITDEWGKVSVIAKGSKRQKHTTLMPIELLHVYKIIYRDKSPQYLNILTHMDIVSSYSNVAEDYNQYLSTCNILGLCNTLLQNDQPHRELYNSVKSFLDELLVTPLTTQLVTMKRTAMILDLTGFYPSLLQCYECKKKISTRTVMFSFAFGSSICNNCWNHHSDSMQLELKTLYLIDYLKKGAVDEMKHYGKHNFLQAEQLLTKHIAYITEKRSKKPKI